MKETLPKVITIMWFHTFGHMKSIQIKLSTIKYILYSAALVVLITLISLAFNLFYFIKNQNLEADIKSLDLAIKNTKAVCAELQEAHVNPDESTQVVLNIKPKDQDDKLENNPDEIEQTVQVDPTTDSLIEISDVKKSLDYKSKKVTIRFQLKHVKSDTRKSISGYVLLIGKNEDVADPVYVTYPPMVKLNKVFPSDYRKGEPFYIKNLKNVRGVLPLEKNDTAIKEVIIYVFSRVGEMLLEKPIPIGVSDDN